MALILATHWARDHFTECSRPDQRTVRNWVAKQVVLGEIIGKQAYVDLEAWQRRVKKSGDDEVDALLQKIRERRGD